ncbi:aspartyl protease family protein [Novosphingobium sp.]|uniref:retroviral-like aspartic protease family protein n=1 Tax=Novosphingobium sp. TaxID=1874826 RepID=UPI00261EE90F|nr:aspartyl protease family protein [Novosphingobium sp.]
MFWGLAIAGLCGLAQPVFAKCTVGMVARLPVTMEGPRATVPVEVNGKTTNFWLDSGAFYSIMSKARAAELGLKTTSMPPGFYISGIGGDATAGVTTVKSFKIVGQELKNLEFLVGGSDAGNALIGQNILSAFDTEYDLANGHVNLIQTKDCRDVNLAYWAEGKPVAMADMFKSDNELDRHIRVKGEINGKPVTLLLDTGATASYLNRSAAERIGIDFSAPGVVQSESTSGFGKSYRRTWIVTLKTFGIGGEEIRNTPIRVIENKGDSPNYDVLVGVDFFLSHRLFVSPAGRHVFLTYNGGPIFSMTTDGEIGARSTRAEGGWGMDNTEAPKDAAGFAQRASARASRGDWKAASADYDQAIKLEPGKAAYWQSRANARWRSGDDAGARADFDKAIALAPNDADLVIQRGFLRLREGDEKGALADAEAALAGYHEGSLERLAAVALFDRLHRADRVLALIDPIIALHKSDNELGNLLNTRCYSRALANIELAKALADCNSAIKRNGPIAAFIDSRAMVKVRQGDLAGALADYDDALAKAPKQAASLYMRGWTRRAAANGDAEKLKQAEADFAAAKAVDADIAERFTPYGFAP